jgi:lysophospholipid acyltransferase (LPLAT)-like uncharacterized protein
MTAAHPDKTAPRNVAWWHWLWVAPLAGLLRLWLSTLRVREAKGFREVEELHGGPSVLILWHDRLFFIPIVTQRYLRRPSYALVSASKDGGWLTAFYTLMGIRCARGSSSSRGMEAMISLARAVRGGGHAGITPDGPKGPRRVFKPGALQLARVTGRPLMLLGIRYHSAWHLRSWDRFALPVPFSKVDLTLEAAGQLMNEETEIACDRLGERLSEISGD